MKKNSKKSRKGADPANVQGSTRSSNRSNDIAYVFSANPEPSQGTGSERSVIMQINLSGHHVDISSALRDYVTSKMKKLERHFDHVTNAHVVLTIEKQVQKAEASVHISGGVLFADAIDGDMYAAIDALTDKLDRQIRRHKEKLTDHRRGEGGIKAMQGE